MSNHEPSHLLTSATLELMECIPLPMVIYRFDGVMHAMNTAAENFWQLSREQYLGTYNVTTDDPHTGRFFIDARERARREGAFERTPPVRDVRGAGTPQESEIWFQPVIFPIRDTGDEVSHIGYIYRDVTDQVRQAQTLDRAQHEIEAQQQIIQELSTPIVQVWDGIILLPIIGAIDNRRATGITEDLLVAIGHYSAEAVILDITGVPMVDTAVANYLIVTARAVRLLGATVALVGIRGEIAQTLVSLGIDLSQLHCQSNLRAGIAWALDQQGLAITRKQHYSLL